MKKRISAAIAVIMMTSVPTAGFADEGRRAQRVWNPEDPAASLLAGNEVCTGSSRQHTCAVYVPLTQEINLQMVSRPIGLNQNIVANRIVAADATGMFRRGENGQLMPAIMDVRSSDNSAAVWNRNLGNILSAGMNGTGAATIGALTNPCGSGCGTSNVIVNQGSQALAQSLSESNAGVNSSVNLQGLAGCASSGACGGTDPHRQ